MTIVEMRVHMDCSGCESKIKKALTKLEGVDVIDVDMNMQKVTVTGYADQKKVLKTVRKTGRRAELWAFPPYNHGHSTFDSNYYYNKTSYPSSSNHLYSSSQHQPPSYSSYNYNKHGYDSYEHSYYHQQPAHSNIINDHAGSMFSDENPNACSIM